MTDATDRFSFFADAPDLSGIAWPEEASASDSAPPTSRVQIAKTGAFRHARYGAFKVTRDTFDSFIANFNAGIPTDRLPVDFDHEPDMGGSSAACGWIKRLEADGSALYAHVAWTWEGASAIREQRYRYVSPTWSMSWVDETGAKLGPTLLAFALTNRPWFTMPAVSLSRTFSIDALTHGQELALPVTANGFEWPDEAEVDGAFNLLVHAGVLEEGHRRTWGDRYPANAAVIDDHGPEHFESFLDAIRSSAIMCGDVAAAVDPIDALDEEVRARAAACDIHWWSAVSELVGDPALASWAPPPLLPIDHDANDDALARRHAHREVISYLDAAQLVEHDRQITTAGYDLELRAQRRERRDEFLKEAKAAEAERREEALRRLRRKRQPLSASRSREWDATDDVTGGTA